MARGDLGDAEWGIIGGLLPPERGRQARPAHDNRRFLDGMPHILRTGCPWRDMHERYGKWNSVYVRFRRWAKQGVWNALLQTLVDLGLTDDWRHMIDSTTVRCHWQAAGARGDSQSGLWSKPQWLYEQNPRARRRPGSRARLRADRRRGVGLHRRRRSHRAAVNNPKQMLGDKGYDSDEVRASLLLRASCR